MNYADVAEQIDARLRALPGLSAHYLGQWRKSVSVPCSVVPLPDIDYHQAYANGMERVPEWEIAILAGGADDIEAYRRLGRYASSSGEYSVRRVLESTDAEIFEPYTACHLVIVKSVTFDVITWQNQDFQGALFTLDVVGSGD